MTIFSESIVGPVAIPHRSVFADHACSGWPVGFASFRSR